MRLHTVRRTGFTLIEVLVVVAIIALLVAILIPSLSRARELSRASVCLSNQHQIGIALRTYAAENRAYLPLQVATMIEWITDHTRKSFAKTIGKNANVMYCPNDPTAARASEYWFKPTFHETFNDPKLGRFDVDYHAIGYYYLGNPRFPGAASPDLLWIDMNKNKRTDDEYVCRIDDKHAGMTVVLSCRIEPQGPREFWTFRHPRGSRTGKSNVVFGDGHAEPRRHDRVLVRWHQPRPVGW